VTRTVVWWQLAVALVLLGASAWAQTGTINGVAGQQVGIYRVCDIPVGDTSASVALTNAQLGPQSRVCLVSTAAAIVEVDVNADGGTPSVILGRNHAGTIANIVGSALSTAANGGIACANFSGGTGLNGVTTCAATLQNAALAAGDYIELVSGTAGGTAKFCVVHVVYQDWAIAPPTYTHYVPITTASGQEGTADSPNFPVLVNTDVLGISSYFKSVANSGYINNTVAQAGGVAVTEPADAVVGTTPNCSTLLPWETEYYGGAASGSWIFHVQLPTLHHGSTDTFYVCFGQAAVSTQQNVGSSAPSAVWSNGFVRVYHYATGSLLTDSTGNYNAANSGATASAGQIDGGAAFSGSQIMNLSAGGLGSLVNNGSLTASMWIYSTGSAGTQCVYGDDDNTAQNESLEIQVLKGGPNLSFKGELHTSSGVVWPTASSYTTYSGPVYFSEVYDVTQNKVWTYVNASATDAGDATSGTLNNGVHMAAGQYGNYPYCSFTGTLDEVRFSNVPRSPSWITAEYNNQMTSSTFLTAGSLH